MSPSILFPFVVVMAIGLCHVTSVQSAGIPGIVASLISRRSMGNGQWRRVVNAVPENEHERKSVTMEEEDDDSDEEGRRLDRDYLEAAIGLPERRERVRSPSSSFRGDLRSAILKRSGDALSKRGNPLELKDRDYFEAIGIAPSYYQPSKYRWNDDDEK